jgi:hypothetical protein
MTGLFLLVPNVLRLTPDSFLFVLSITHDLLMFSSCFDGTVLRFATSLFVRTQSLEVSITHDLLVFSSCFFGTVLRFATSLFVRTQSLDVSLAHGLLVFSPGLVHSVLSFATCVFLRTVNVFGITQGLLPFTLCLTNRELHLAPNLVLLTLSA